MIYLRDRALTRQKITKKLINSEGEKDIEFTQNIKEDEKKIIENNNIFINYVHQINELLKLLKKISKKGFTYSFLEKEDIIEKKIKIY